MTAPDPTLDELLRRLWEQIKPIVDLATRDPQKDWGEMPQRHVSEWDLRDALRWCLYWAETWNHQSGGHIPPNVRAGIARCMQLAQNPQEGCSCGCASPRPMCLNCGLGYPGEPEP
jgi:hypothetical protein